MNRRMPIIFLALCGAGLVLGIWALFRLRFEVGDVYPEYSSLRADPLGTMALYESLEEVEGLVVSRDFSDEDRLPEEPGATYLHLAATRHDWQALPQELAGDIQRFTTRGGRLVITFLPESVSPFRMISGTRSAPGKAPVQKGTNAPAAKAPRKKTAPPGGVPGITTLKAGLGLQIGSVPIADEGTEIAERAGEAALPEKLRWHSSTVFTNLDLGWRVVYARGSNAVVIERKIGTGSIVLASDSYFLSNEALARERHAELLAWLVGPAKRVYFDEAHLGIMDTTGVATLMRRYHLEWPAAALVLLAALFIWKNSMSFVPPPEEPAGSDQVEGKEAGLGFANLLRRNISPRDLLRVCFDEWAKSLGGDGRHTIWRVDEAQAVLEREAQRARVEQSPAQAYNEISRALSGKPRIRNL